ncbi:helix-turn-helix domain-containing protein [Amycolatopsis sp. H20-H5]|uniref:helix-turn-helix domain-containing protein n=1 Tax=Amycolatopsis sp. H20-H5 TaxID=3046309 RepID=UPI002DBD919C|nr:helix-turn-helix transcriptional regulator [Amycolatopsis sp. H20-H5]MEC3974870.1 helix-turn-helix transcriptional regulator [Amycolatopsis sp. H20-H5]
MRQALHKRDIAGVFVLLRRHGVSQRRIAALTGQSQSEVSEICHGRQVMAYDLLARVADGLGIPRGLMGLAYSPDTAGISAALTAVPMAAREVTDSMPDRREFLGVLAKVAVGAGLGAADLAILSTPAHATPAPVRVGATEVQQVRQLTHVLWVQEKALGGGAVREAGLAQLGWVRQLLRGSYATETGHTLYAVLADLLGLVGWASHDVGLAGDALRYLGQSMAAAAEIDDPMRTALAIEQVARVYLRQGEAGEALKALQLGTVAADRSRVGQVQALILSTTARAYADTGQVPAALDALSKADAALSAGPPATVADLVIPDPRGFDAATLESETGRVLSIAAAHDRAYAPRAIEALTAYTATTDPVRVKRRAISTAQLSTALFQVGEAREAVTTGRAALTLASAIRSQRVTDYLAEVHVEAMRLPRHRDAADLARAITTASHRAE